MGTEEREVEITDEDLFYASRILLDPNFLNMILHKSNEEACKEIRNRLIEALKDFEGRVTNADILESLIELSVIVTAAALKKRYGVPLSQLMERIHGKKPVYLAE